MVHPLITVLFVAGAVAASSVRNIYWNTTNEVFQNPGQDNLVMVNEDNLPWEYDQVNIICPVFKPGTDDNEQHIIYSVEKEEYENCRVTNPRPKIVAICNRPQRFMYFTITFRSFTPTPGGLEFRPGHDYYFISTANKNDIHRRVGGWCSTHNMKMRFRVADSDSEEEPVEKVETSTVNSIPTPAAFWSKYWSARVPDGRDNYIFQRENMIEGSSDVFQQDSSSDRSRIYQGLLPRARVMDKSVDITITANTARRVASSSGRTAAVSIWLLILTVLSSAWSRS